MTRQTLVAIAFTAALAMALGRGPTAHGDDSFNVVRIISDVDRGAVDMVVNPDTNRIYMTAGINSTGTTLNVVDAGSGQLLTKVQVRANSDIGLNRATNTLYALDYSGSVGVVDGATNRVIARIDVGPEPTAIAVDPVTNRIYVNQAGLGISVIDGDTNTVVSHIDHVAGKMAVDSTTNRLYVLAPTLTIGSTSMAVFDGATNALVGEVEIGPAPFNAVVDPGQDRIYVAQGIETGAGPGQLKVIDTQSLSVLNTLPLPDRQLSELALDPTAHIIYGVNFYTNSLSVFDATGSLLATIKLGSGPSTVTVDEVRHLAYVGMANVDEIEVVGTGPSLFTPSPSPSPSASQRITGDLPVGGGPPPADRGYPVTLVAALLAMITAGCMVLLAVRRSS